MFIVRWKQIRFPAVRISISITNDHRSTRSGSEYLIATNKGKHVRAHRPKWGGLFQILFPPPTPPSRTPIMSAANQTTATNPAQEDDDPDAILQEISELLSTLRNNEMKWRDRHEMLDKEGYVLRPRLQPGWTPSWLQSGKSPLECEDGEPLPVDSSPNHCNHRTDS